MSEKNESAVQFVVDAKSKDLGGFNVQRVLPSPKCRMVGPFVFFDYFGPADFPPGEGIEVRPHPHIGIATITYLFEGEIIHRDSLGVTQAIQPGAVNLMTAGRGIVHSERAGKDKNIQSRLHGIQSWIALPVDQQEMEPAFKHYPAKDLPEIRGNGFSGCLIMGSAYGAISPVKTYAQTLYAELKVEAHSEIEVPNEYEQRAIYIVSGTIQIEEQTYEAGSMPVLVSEEIISIRAVQDSHLMFVGGEAFGSRYLWWNFVSSSEKRIEKAKSDWREGRFESVAGDEEFIPLPEN